MEMSMPEELDHDRGSVTHWKSRDFPYLGAIARREY